MTWALCILAAYLVGSIPFGLLIGLARGIDIREHGSRNIGATNTGRVLGRRFGYLCFALDVLKGALPVAIAGFITGAVHRSPLPNADAWLWIAVAIAAVIGHMHPVYLKFRGGKGVATGLGVLLGLWGHLTWPALLALLIWIISARVTRYVSVSSCIAALSIPLIATAFALFPSDGLSHPESLRESWPFLAMTTVLAALVIWKHRANIARLRAGTEPRIGAKRPDNTETAL